MATQQYLRYDPTTNQYVWGDTPVLLPEEIEPSSSPSLLTGQNFGESGGVGEERSTTLEGPPGSIHDTAFGLSAFGTIVDVSSAASNPLGAAVSGASALSDLSEKKSRAEAFSAAKAPGATIADKLRASQHAATKTDLALDVADIGLSALSLATGPLGILGLARAVVGTISDYFSREDAKTALQEAATAEQKAAITGQPTAYGFGYVNTAANFQEQQAKNLAATSPSSPTEFSATTAQETIEEALSSATASSLGTGSLSSAGAGFSRDSGSTGSFGGYNAGATNPDYNAGSFGGSDGSGGGGYGTAGGYGGDFGGVDASETGGGFGGDVGGGFGSNVA